jgi:hypothetical protein
MVEEICTSCHDGILIETIQEQEGSTKKFSCGHKSLTRTLSEQNISIQDSLATLHRLGPQSTAPVSSTVSHTASAVVVSMQQEMYKDALYFFEQAKANETNMGDSFITWRNLRATILFSFAAIESCINQFIDTQVDQNKGRMLQRDIDFWTEKTYPYPSIAKKLNDGVEFFGGKGKRLENDVPLWKDFGELKQLRDDLAHFKVGNQLFYETKRLFVNVEKGIRTTSSVIKKIYLAHPQNISYPPVFDTVP